MKPIDDVTAIAPANAPESPPTAPPVATAETGSGGPPAAKRKGGWKHWALFGLRWGIAVVGVYIVVKNMSVRDQAWVILDHQTNRPVQVSLRRHVDDAAATYPVYEPGANRALDVSRADVVNEKDAKSVTLKGMAGAADKPVQLVGLDLPADLNVPHPIVNRFLIADDATAPARWVAASAVVGYQLKTPYPRDQVGLGHMVREARPSKLWLALLVFPITFVITSYRWHELLIPLEIHIGIARTFTLNMVGAFYNTFMPGSTGGDALKAWYASKQTPHRTRAVMSVLIDRVVGLLALIIVGGVAAATQPEIGACRKVALAAGLICLVTGVGLLVFYVPVLYRLSGLGWAIGRLPMQKQVQNAVKTMKLYGKRPVLALWTLVISLPVHATVVTSAMFAGQAFGLPLAWTYYWVAVPVIVLAGAIPISPQGAGVMEGFAILLTRGQGVTVSQAFALTMSIRMVQIIWNLTGGLFVLRGGFHAPTETERAGGDLGGVPAVAV